MTSLFKEKLIIPGYQSSSLQMFFKKGVRKDFAKFTGKQLCWSLFLVRRSAGLSKRDSNTGVFLWIFCEIFKNTVFTEYLRWLHKNLSERSFVEYVFLQRCFRFNVQYVKFVPLVSQSFRRRFFVVNVWNFSSDSTQTLINNANIHELSILYAIR